MRKPRPTKQKKERAAEIFHRLLEQYPAASCALVHRDAFQLLAATILSAQCTDERVNMVTPHLFERYPDAHAMAEADQDELQEIIRSTGFFRNKASNLIGMARAVVENHDGVVPGEMDPLVKLPGVGRKTANVVLGNVFGKDEGVVVDTHVKRLSTLLRLTRQKDPEKIEHDLMALYPREQWTILAHLFIFHGRQVCIARRPRCGECVLSELCPSST